MIPAFTRQTISVTVCVFVPATNRQTICITNRHTTTVTYSGTIWLAAIGTMPDTTTVTVA